MSEYITILSSIRETDGPLVEHEISELGKARKQHRATGWQKTLKDTMFCCEDLSQR